MRQFIIVAVTKNGLVQRHAINRVSPRVPRDVNVQLPRQENLSNRRSGVGDWGWIVV